MKHPWITAQIIILAFSAAFTGALLGTERSLMPAIAKEIFGISNKDIMLSFILTFGITKVAMNFLAGRLANHYGRKKLLVAGWLIGALVPLLLIFAQNWWWIVAANALLGIHQGLTWSMALLMKIERAPTTRRGAATGLNEFSGYFCVALSALASSQIAKHFGIYPYPFYLSGLFVIGGLLLSVFWVEETKTLANANAENEQAGASEHHRFTVKQPFLLDIFKHRNQRTSIIGGLINNLNDAVVWGVVPMLLAQKGLDVAQIGWVAAVYPLTWGVLQWITGQWSDKIGRKPLMVAGMLVRGSALALLTLAQGMPALFGLAMLMGAGTSLLYPAFIASVADHATPEQRPLQLGIYRAWRDMGFVFGASIASLLLVVAAFSLIQTLWVVAALTICAGIFIQLSFQESAK